MRFKYKIKGIPDVKIQIIYHVGIFPRSQLKYTAAPENLYLVFAVISIKKIIYMKYD